MSKEKKTKTEIMASRARNTKRSEREAYYEIRSNDIHRVESWREEIRALLKEKGLNENFLKQYIGRTGHLISKLPQQRETYIGIGMALKQDENTINNWIKRYSNKKELYVKEMGDLVWGYLIKAALNDPDPENNYFEKYEVCLAETMKEYHKIYQQLAKKKADQGNPDVANTPTDIMKESFKKDVATFENLKVFIAKNIKQFDAAYQRSRMYIKNIVEGTLFPLMIKYEVNKELIIIVSKRSGKGRMKECIPASYHAFFTQGQINRTIENYLTGKEGSRVRPAPISRRANISMCLCFGLSEKQINEYLGILGYEPLKAVSDINEGMLIHFLSRWDEEHPLAVKFRKKHYEGQEITLSEEEEKEALEQILGLKDDMRFEFDRSDMNISFSGFDHEKNPDVAE